jgi:DNA-binding NarL/FixJ family response regulator
MVVGRTSRATVLIVDDDALMRYALTRELAREFDVVGEAADGREAVHMAERLRPDVVLLDVSMPVMGGFEAAKELRRLLPETVIIFVSSHADPTYEDEALGTGAVGYVAKNAASARLCQAIRTALTGSPFPKV